MWDGSTWLILGLVAACCMASMFFNDGIGPLIVSMIMLVFVITTFISIYYKINGDQLIVYTLFFPHHYPIDKIRDIKPTKSTLSAPATSLTHRLAITFTDRKILKSSMPLIISPAHPDEFIQDLLAVNPDIQHQG